MTEQPVGSNTTPKWDFSRLSAIISVFGINSAIWQAVDDYLVAENPEQPINLGVLISEWGVKERQWEVLEMRSGFVKYHTYDEIGESWGVGRARAQQVGQKALVRLEKGLYQMLPLFVDLEAIVDDLWPVRERNKSVNSAVFVQQDALLSIGWEQAEGSEIRNLLLALRSLVNAKLNEVTDKLPKLSYFACSLSPLIIKHPRIAEEITVADAIQNPRWTYEVLVETILKEAGRPLHYKEIAERADIMKVRSEISLKGVHNVLYIKDDKFACVGQGTYGLVAWGLTSVDAYNDIIAEAMKNTTVPLTLSEITFYVSGRREINPKSLQMTLDLHPRFYRTVMGTYGLRSRLPAREKQTLRTPHWLIEAPSSFERLEKATERGYDVDALVARDFL